MSKRAMYGLAGAALGYYLLPGFVSFGSPLMLAAGAGFVAYQYGPEYIGV